VELYLRSDGSFYVVRRSFNPSVTGALPDLTIQCDHERSLAYALDPETGSLEPVADFVFAIEVYEQGRIGRLREDVGRQLEMLDEFANLQNLIQLREEIIAKLNNSAKCLKPLYDKREQLQSEVASVEQYEEELEEKQQYLPDETEQRKWANAGQVIESIQEVVDELTITVAKILGPDDELLERTGDLEMLFGHRSIDLITQDLVYPELLIKWKQVLDSALAELETARQNIVATVRKLTTSSSPLKGEWSQVSADYHRRVSRHVAQAGVESPKELINRVAWLRKEINVIRGTKLPLLGQVNGQIEKEETAREGLLNRLEQLDRETTARRQQKAQELTKSLHGQMKVSVEAAMDRTAYQKELNELCSKVVSQHRQIKGREGQLNQIVKAILPLDLAQALRQRGKVQKSDGSFTTLQELCGITENTQNVLCSIADNIEYLNRLQTVPVPDVPEILVRRRGESNYGHLRTGLSPGEQSAAILTLALQTRTAPLILDQPEEELGYNYVVDMIVPKILEAKSVRQLLVVTLYANIPVLGDADFVMKMVNRPSGNSRQCTAAVAGCFESRSVTEALLELEGGERAFQFRQHRYQLGGSPMPSAHGDRKRTAPAAPVPAE
jgi:hypothetical protein